MTDVLLPSNQDNVLKLANQAELKKARETISAVLVPDLPAEIIARAFMRLQCADVPREPWQWEVCQILQTPQVTPDETSGCEALVRQWHAATLAMETPDMEAKLTAQRRVVDAERKLMVWANSSAVEPTPVKAIPDPDPNERCGYCSVKRSLHNAGGVGSCGNWRPQEKASEFRPLCAHGNFADECPHPHTDVK